MEQNIHEFTWLLERIAGAHSLLEIGSRRGASLIGFARVCASGAGLYSIDLGHDAEDTNAPWYGDNLKRTIIRLRACGFEAEVLHGDSHRPTSKLWAEMRAPFDFVFIDGDHSYEGVKQDWHWYGPLGKIVAFHDIAYYATGVPQFWDELKRAGHRTEEIVVRGMTGIGLVKPR